MKKKSTKHYFKIIKKIERVRSKNNVNWMDVLRLSFKHAPKESRKLIKKINLQDKRISNLITQLAKK
tara:strand:- start:43615 stop:43815 length:201 start_codon:yes stop_codon:yes gene_type:complete